MCKIKYYLDIWTWWYIKIWKWKWPHKHKYECNLIVYVYLLFWATHEKVSFYARNFSGNSAILSSDKYILLYYDSFVDASSVLLWTRTITVWCHKKRLWKREESNLYKKKLWLKTQWLLKTLFLIVKGEFLMWFVISRQNDWNRILL